MPEPRFRMKKIWRDTDFFEVNVSLTGTNCMVDMDLYLDNVQLEELRNGVYIFANQLSKNEFKWVTGAESDNNMPFLSMRFFLHDRRGIIGIEINVDNRLEVPNAMQSTFYILTEINQVDDFIRQLEKFIKDEILVLESIR
ncbi:hypothetical protein [Sutcliffiella horikoshii]|uniref:hypothetical protein n=1 Tax=Sutcliffiella horikoshii TaxID=79883 RepID=UPI001CFD8B45|nr:hypothetical protein [Sutcliffiella horikoshii]